MSALAIISTVFGVLGAYGFGEACVRRVKRSRALRSNQQLLSNAPSDFCYEFADVGVVISDQGEKWHMRRGASITALINNVQSIQVGGRPLHAAGNAEFWVLPSNLNLEEITSASLAGYRRFNVKPPAALLKGEQLLFEFHSKFVKTAPVPNRDEFTWVASRLVKHVVLRVVFTDRKPDVMEFVVLDNSGVLRRRREILSGDPLTGEYRKEIPSADLDGPQPDLTYALQWRYNS